MECEGNDKECIHEYILTPTSKRKRHDDGQFLPTTQSYYTMEIAPLNRSKLGMFSPEIQSAKQKAGHFWQSRKIRHLFPSHDDASANIALMIYNSVLHRCLKYVSNIPEIVSGYSEEEPLTNEQTVIILHKFQVLYCAYNKSLSLMEHENKTWKHIIDITIEKEKSIGIFLFDKNISVMRLHHVFLFKLTFPHPNKYICCGKRPIPKLFSTYPESSNQLSLWCSPRLHTLFSEAAASYIRNVLIPSIYELHVNEFRTNPDITQHTMDTFLNTLHLKNVCNATAWRWLRYLGFKHTDQMKGYYNDKHEDPENVQQWGQYIQTYLNLEVRAHHWVHLHEKESLRLQTEHHLPSAYHLVDHKGCVWHEYYVDTHGCLFQYVKK